MAWNAEIRISKSDDGYFDVYCPTRGDTPEEALEAAEFVMNTFAEGKRAMLRRVPHASTETDAETKATINNGFVRFSFRNEPGEWEQLTDQYMDYDRWLEIYGGKT